MENITRYHVWVLFINKMFMLSFLSYLNMTYRQTFNISRTWVGTKIVDHSDVVEAAPIDVPTTFPT